jgi:transcriptional regulator with XRE-family HTH domain
MKIDKKQVGIRIHELRTQNNWSMEELANKIKASGKSTINEWEKGRTIPSKKFLEQLAKSFNVSENYIKFGSFKNYVVNLIRYTLDDNNKIKSPLSSLEEYFYMSLGSRHLSKGEISFLESTNHNDIVESYLKSENSFLENLTYDNDFFNYLKKQGISYGDDNKIISAIEKYFSIKAMKLSFQFIGSARTIIQNLNTQSMNLLMSTGEPIGKNEKNKKISYNKKYNKPESSLKDELYERLDKENLDSEFLNKIFSIILKQRMESFESDIQSLIREFNHINKKISNPKN